MNDGYEFPVTASNMNEYLELPVTTLHMKDDYDRPVKVSNVDVEYNTIESVTDTKVKPKEVPSGYTNTKIVIIILATTVVLSTCICVAFYFVIAKNCSSSGDNVTTDATTKTTTTTYATPTTPTLTTTPRTTTPTQTTTEISTSCANEWTEYNKLCYLFGKGDKITFNETMDFCRGLGGTAVIIDSSDENEFVKNYLRNVSGGISWLDLTDELQESVWRWSGTGELATFFNWIPRQPSNGINEDCAVFWDVYDYQHDDTNCGSLHYPICEMQLST